MFMFTPVYLSMPIIRAMETFVRRRNEILYAYIVCAPRTTKKERIKSNLHSFHIIALFTLTFFLSLSLSRNQFSLLESNAEWEKEKQTKADKPETNNEIVIYIHRIDWLCQNLPLNISLQKKCIHLNGTHNGTPNIIATHNKYISRFVLYRRKDKSKGTSKLDNRDIEKQKRRIQIFFY